MNQSQFRPHRMASWWCSIEDLLWPETRVTDKIKRRAEGFAKAGIDTAINFGFHARFDFSNYFGSLHGYLNAVSEALHEYGIRYMDHYSCNIVERPRNRDEFLKMHTSQRHHILLHPDEKAAALARYEGHLFTDICEMDVRDGSRGYTWSYQGELFCHNNPDFLDMHQKYLKRLLNEVALDAIEVDDMCDYAYLTTCGCPHCREKFKRYYGHTLPPFEDKSFWGNTDAHPTAWGNYENPVFRDWIRFKTDSVADHVKMIKSTVGALPLMTCCSSTGPILLNTLGLNLERIMPDLDLFMLENCGTSVRSADWSRMDAEALIQKDIADKKGNQPAVALSYSLYPAGAYFGWALSRFWGVGNWSSTLYGRLEKEPEQLTEVHTLVGDSNNWEIRHSDLDIENGRDLPEVRLVSSADCRMNGFRDENGVEQWTKVSQWSKALLENNIGYRFLRTVELGDEAALCAANTPLILDGVGCLSDKQYQAICGYLAKGGKVWLRKPFGTHDEKGFLRAESCLDSLLKTDYDGLVLLENETAGETIQMLKGTKLHPRVTQVSGDACWSVRLRRHPNGIVMHLMNRALEAVPSDELRDAASRVPILADIRSGSRDDHLSYLIDFSGAGEAWSSAALMSPELGDAKRPVMIERLGADTVKITLDVTGVRVYAVVQGE